MIATKKTVSITRIIRNSGEFRHASPHGAFSFRADTADGLQLLVIEAPGARSLLSELIEQLDSRIVILAKQQTESDAGIVWFTVNIGGAVEDWSMPALEADTLRTMLEAHPSLVAKK